MIAWPVTTAEHRNAVERVLNSGVYVEGPEARALEEEFAEYAGRKYAVAVSSGSAAVEVALAAAGVGKGWNVGIPAYTFAGSAFGALRVGADISWMDVSEETFLSEDEHWQSGIDAAVVVHLFGQAAPIPSGCLVVEDCAQAFGAEDRNGPVGRSGVVAAWSLNTSKTVWGGEGGMVATDDEGIADTARYLRDYGELWEPADPRSYNWKMSEIEAAMARVSLSQLDGWVEKARAAGKAMSEKLEGHPIFIAPKEAEGRRHVYHQYRIMCRGGIPEGLFAQTHLPTMRWQYLPLPSVGAFGAHDPSQWPGAKAVGERTFSLGFDDELPPCVWAEEQIDEWAAAAWRIS